MGLKETFNKMPTRATLEFKHNGYYHILLISWIEKGRGFGQYCFYVDEDRKIKLDNECDSPETIKRVLDHLVDTQPEEVKKMFHQMVDCCEHDDSLDAEDLIDESIEP